MYQEAGLGPARVDCIHFAPCEVESMYYCRMYCQHWQPCRWLSERAKACRRRKLEQEKS